MKNNAEILVVDDVPANLEVITETLASAGYIVAATTSGERALKRLQTYIPDLILLDIQMPGINGFETYQKIRETPANQHIPVIFVTAFSDTDNIVKGFSLGGADYVTKPFKEEELLARVNTHLQIKFIHQTLEKKVEERTRNLECALAQLKASQLRLVQQEKMSTLGNLIAGIAHELNNPVSFLSGNISPAKDYSQNLLDLIDIFITTTPHLNEQVIEKIHDIDLDFIRQDFPKLLRSMAFGIDLVNDISMSLRTFSRSDQKDKTPFNLHDGLDSTLMILRHRLKAIGDRPAITVVKHYGDIPPVQCFPSQINQVFINILANAIDAIEETYQDKSPEEIQTSSHQITIKTIAIDDAVVIYLRDSGAGISGATQQQIFEPLYTTKEVGKGTGLGLAIAYQIVTEVHEGQLEVTSESGQGAEFCIHLPIS